MRASTPTFLTKLENSSAHQDFALVVLALPPGPHQPAIVSPQDLVGKTVGTASAGVMPSNVAGMPYSLDTVATQS